MKRVTIVNLAGRAWHIEDDGVTALDAWLDAARRRLAADPDVDELVEDFERAIADRLGAVARDERDVVTDSQVADVLDALGPVEPADPDPTTTPAEPGTDVPLRDRRLFRLPDDGMVSGVSAGLAAYLRLDVTIIRVLWVVLTFATGGAAFLVYLAMWLLVPEATSPEDRARARGEGLTAEEMLARARVNASPALAQLGSLIVRASRLLVRAVRWVALAVIWVLLATWAFSIGMLVVHGDILVDLFDPGTSTWIVALWLTCIAWVPLALLLAVERGLAAVLRAPRSRRRGVSAAMSGVGVISFALAIVGVYAIPVSHSQDIAGLRDGHGTFVFDDQLICVDVDDAGPADEDDRPLPDPSACDETIS